MMNSSRACLNYYASIQERPIVAYAYMGRLGSEEKKDFSAGVNYAAVFLLKGAEIISCARQASSGIGTLDGHSERRALVRAFNRLVDAEKLKEKKVTELELAKNAVIIKGALEKEGIKAIIFTELSPCEHPSGCSEVLLCALPNGSEVYYAVDWSKNAKTNHTKLEGLLRDIKKQFFFKKYVCRFSFQK